MLNLTAEQTKEFKMAPSLARSAFRSMMGKE